MKKIFLPSLFLLLNTFCSPLLGQGCSSAGFCTMGVLKVDQKFSESRKIKLNYIEISQLTAFSGLGETINAATLDFSLSLGAKNRVQIRLPYAWVNGDLAQTNAFGDVYLTYSRSLIAKKNYSIQAMVGTKFPRFTTDLRTAEGLPLPLYYSPSLGTYDLVLGLSFVNKKWLLGVGYQQALGEGITDNTFDPRAWEGSNLFAQALRYDASGALQRGNDLMLRIERQFRAGRFNFFVGAMPVYRLRPDRVLGPEGRVPIAGSEGWALTGITGGGYSLDVHSSVKLFYGNGLIKRAANPDGLMKTSVFTLAYEWRF